MYLQKAIFKDLMIEYAALEKNTKTIILLPGMPYYPRPDKYMKELAMKGFNSIYIRYPGTYESNGKFLEEDPASSVSELIDHLKKEGTFVELYNGTLENIHSSEIIVIATSFGGAVGFSLLKNTTINQLVAISPVINSLEFYQLDGMAKDAEKLKKFLTAGFRNTYRFDERDYDELVAGTKIVSIDPSTINTKTTIIISEDDTVVPKEHIKQFSFSEHVKIITRKEGGHLSIHSFSVDELITIIEN